MRMTAPVIGGTAVALAVALVWYFRPPSDPSAGLDESAAPVPAAAEPARESIAPPRTATRVAEPPAAPASAEPAASAARSQPERSPLPGEAPATPMVDLLGDRAQNMIVRNDADSGGIPPQLAEGEKEFAAEPIDASWAPAAEADLLGRFARMQGLTLIDLKVECRTTMCRVQVTQPPLTPGPGNGQPFNILRDDIGFKPRWMMTIGGGLPPGPVRSIAYLWREGFAPDQGAQQ